MTTYDLPTSAEITESLADAQTRLAELEGELSTLKKQLADPKTDVKGLAKLYQALTGELWVWKARAEALAAAKPASITADRLRELQKLSAEFEAVSLKRRALKGFRQQVSAFTQEVDALANEVQRAEDSARREINTLSEALRREGVSQEDIQKVLQHVF